MTKSTFRPKSQLALESLQGRVLPSVAAGYCFSPPPCSTVPCEVSHVKPACPDKVEHTPSSGDQHSICLFGAEVGKGNEKSSHGKVDLCEKSNGGSQKSSHGQVDASKFHGGSQKSSHGKVDACTPPKPTPCPTPPVACTNKYQIYDNSAPGTLGKTSSCDLIVVKPTPPVACTPPAPKPPVDTCSKSHGGIQHSSHGKSSHGKDSGKSNGGQSKSSHGHVELGSHSHGGHQQSHAASKTHSGPDRHGNCYDDGYAMPGRASDMVHALCGVGDHDLTGASKY